MNILDIATQAGLQVLLDARIGSQTYHSVCGSLGALQRFADAVSAATRAESPEHGSKGRRQPAPRPAAAAAAPSRRSRRSRRRAALCAHAPATRERAPTAPR